MIRFSVDFSFLFFLFFNPFIDWCSTSFLLFLFKSVVTRKQVISEKKKKKKKNGQRSQIECGTFFTYSECGAFLTLTYSEQRAKNGARHAEICYQQDQILPLNCANHL